MSVCTSLASELLAVPSILAGILPGNTFDTSAIIASACSAVPTLAASSSGTPTVVTTTTSNVNPTVTLLATATGTAGLYDYAKVSGRYFGTAADIPGTGELSDMYYMAELNNTNDWNQLTPGNIMKWEYIEPQQNIFDYTGADLFVSIAKANNQLLRCHNLCWYNQNPGWLTNGQWTNETLLAVLENHIDNVVSHFGNECYHWDVVNEALNEDGTYRENIWYNVTGPSYIYTAFSAAEAAVKRNNLQTKLYYNDYNIESPGLKASAAQTIISDIKARGIQIDGAGLQSHFIVGGTPSTESQVQNMNAFVALGVEVAITELDIRTTLPPTLEAEEQQLQDYQSTISACQQVKECVGVTVWDFDDNYSWIPSTFPGQGYADLFFQPAGKDTPLVKKAVYDSVIAGWNVSGLSR